MIKIVSDDTIFIELFSFIFCFFNLLLQSAPLICLFNLLLQYPPNFYTGWAQVSMPCIVIRMLRLKVLLSRHVVLLQNNLLSELSAER